MTSLQIAVTLAGIAAIVWVNWYFFLAGERPVAASGAGSTGRSRFASWSMAATAPPSSRWRLADRFGSSSSGGRARAAPKRWWCPDFGIRTFLPAHQVTPVQFTPVRPGTYEFTCGMGMVRGRLVARARAGAPA